MTIYNLGSINRDLIYQMQVLPAAGETLAATGMIEMLGGKGLNQSVAAVRAGAELVHIGAIGIGDVEMRENLAALGLDTTAIAEVDHPTGHAIVMVEDAGENAIVLLQGANVQQDDQALTQALSTISATDILMLQNETNLQVEAASLAKSKGALVVYSAAPFSAVAVGAVLEHVDVLVMNAVEAEQLSTAMQVDLFDLPVSTVIVTKGADGADWLDITARTSFQTPAMKANPIDTTGAGDTFIGYVVAALAEGMTADKAMTLGTAAGALMVSRQGTAAVIPFRSEVNAIL